MIVICYVMMKPDWVVAFGAVVAVAFVFWLSWNGRSIAKVFSDLRRHRLWRSRYLYILSLIYDMDQFMQKLASKHNLQLKPNPQKLPEPEKSRFVVKPTVVLRLHTKSGYSVLVRALLDSGTSNTWIYADLVAHLKAKSPDGVHVNYTWPCRVQTFPGDPHFMGYQSFSGIYLSSCENPTVRTEPLELEIDATAFIPDCLPVKLVRDKFAQFGIEMIHPDCESVERMWTNESGKEGQVHILIGQDLLSKYFYISPRMPMVSITDELVVMRTKMGLALMGTFEVDRFARWNPEVQQLRSVLHSDLIEPDDSKSRDQLMEKFARDMTIRLNQSIWKLLSEFIIASILLFHSITLILVSLPFQYLVTRLWSKILDNPTYLYLLFKQFDLAIAGLYHYHPIDAMASAIEQRSLRTRLYTPDRMLYQFSPTLTFAIQNHATSEWKQVRAHIDTGSPYSWISLDLALELKYPIRYSHGWYDSRFCYTKRPVIEKVRVAPSTASTYPEMKLELSLLVPIEDRYQTLPCELSKWIESNVGVAVVDTEEPVKIVIGNDLLTSILLPTANVEMQWERTDTPVSTTTAASQVFGPRCIPLAANLTLMETKLGYFLQGANLTDGTASGFYCCDFALCQESIFSKVSYCTACGIVLFYCILAYFTYFGL